VSLTTVRLTWIRVMLDAWVVALLLLSNPSKMSPGFPATYAGIFRAKTLRPVVLELLAPGTLKNSPVAESRA